MSHAKLSPSSASRWLACAGSLQAPQSDESSEFADEGTAAHTLAAMVLNSPPRENRAATSAYYRETVIDVRNDDGSLRRQFTVDEDMASFVQVYVDAIRDRVTGDAQLLVEQKLDTGLKSTKYGAITGTGDAVILRPFEQTIEVHDLKFGRGVRVVAKDNPQLLLYALGAMHQYAWLMPTLRVKVAIHQPRLDHFDEVEYTLDELLAFANEVKARLATFDNGDVSLNPGESQCRFCPMAATCPALAKYAHDAALEDFAIVADLTEFGIGAAMEKVELVERWCTAVRDEARRLLDAGVRVPGWILAEGRAGNRKWTDEQAVLKTLVTMGDAAFKPRAVISPADAEKKLAKKQPAIWAELQPLIERGPPSVSVVRDDGKHTPVSRTSLDDFKVQL